MQSLDLPAWYLAMTALAPAGLSVTNYHQGLREEGQSVLMQGVGPMSEPQQHHLVWEEEQAATPPTKSDGGVYGYPSNRGVVAQRLTLHQGLLSWHRGKNWQEVD